MKRVLYVIIAFLLSDSTLYAQSNAANAGKEFYISYIHQTYAASTLQLKVVVEKACTITAQYNNQPGVYWYGWNNTLVTQGIYTANVSYNDVVNIPAFGSGGITSRTLTLTSTEDVCVYAINYYNASSDATCVLPVPTWGTEYRLATGDPIADFQGAYAIVANEPGTIVTLHDNSTITLNKNEVYHFLNATAADMTGMRIAATKPVGLFSGTTAAYGPGQSGAYGCSSMGGVSGDHTYEQVWSVDKWGKDFFAFPILTPTGGGNWGGMLALVANENDTKITLSGGINGGSPLNYVLNAGEKQYVCYVMSGLTQIVSDKPIMVFLVLPDACVMYIPPTDQRIHHAFVAPFVLTGNTNIHNHGIDLLIPAAYWDQTVIQHDGVVVPHSLYTVNTSVHFPDWYHVRRNLTDEDIKIDIVCPGGFLAYISGNGSAETYAFSSGAGDYDLQNYFTIQEKGTTIDTYYENTTETTHTFESSDDIVVKRTLESPFDVVTWLINGVQYAIAENGNITNTLYFPASAPEFHSGENTITMSVRFAETTADSLYTGKVWLTMMECEFYANDVHHENLPDTVFCSKNVNFRAEIEDLHPDAGSLKWFIDGTEETAAQDQLKWSKEFETGVYQIEMWVRFENNETATITSTLKVEVFWIKMKNVTH
ncbi:MAG: IgGFc-binding protein [Bacteroidales bacterium]|nr:IgGFc-binding protein [Bacteroidales bacterium]